MSRFSRHNPDAPISHDWTGGKKINRSACPKCNGTGMVKADYADQRIYLCGPEYPCDVCEHDADRRERVILAMAYPAPMADVCKAAQTTCAIARHAGGWPVHHVTTRTQTFGIAT